MNYGFNPSTLDGSEHLFIVDNASDNLPAAFSLEQMLPKVLDQGSKSICVPCSLSASLNWQINLNEGKNGVDNKIDLNAIYKIRKNKKLDGMEIKEALHFLRHAGVPSKKGIIKINEYSMIGSPVYLKYALLINGPCIGALKVYNPNATEFWLNDGRPCLGGHAIAIVGYNNDGFVIRNSWGTKYGEDGYATIPYGDFTQFLELWTLN